MREARLAVDLLGILLGDPGDGLHPRGEGGGGEIGLGGADIQHGSLPQA
jgi:hypothetical protein